MSKVTDTRLCKESRKAQRRSQNTRLATLQEVLVYTHTYNSAHKLSELLPSEIQVRRDREADGLFLSSSYCHTELSTEITHLINRPTTTHLLIYSYLALLFIFTHTILCSSRTYV